MMNRNEWQAVRDALIADDRAKLGPPPAADELLAYERGELSEQDAERVRQLLVAYPDLARAYAAPFPPEGETLPDDVIDRQWKAFRARGEEGGGRVLQFWRGAAALAAALAVVFGAMLWRSETERMQPRVLPEAQLLTPEGRRGAESQHVAVTPSGGSVLLNVSIIGPDYESYRLELVSAESRKRIWTSEPLRATKSDTFEIEIPSRRLGPGTYQVIAYGLRGGAQEPVATYTIDVLPPRPSS